VYPTEDKVLVGCVSVCGSNIDFPYAKPKLQVILEYKIAEAQ